MNFNLQLIIPYYVFMNNLSFKLTELVPPPGSLSPSPSGKLKAEEDNFAATAPIIPGEESTIEINKEKMGLGLNIVGGSDTPMVIIFVFDYLSKNMGYGKLFTKNLIFKSK